MVGQSYTGGVKPMNIAGRYISERERLYGMTDAERAFRRQWLKDQILSPNEPKPVPELYKALHNPIRRFYRWPMEKLQALLTPKLGAEGAQFVRFATSRSAMAILGVYYFVYYAKYNSNNWTSRSGWMTKTSRFAVDKGDPSFPKVSDRTKPSDYASKGFNKNTLNL